MGTNFYYMEENGDEVHIGKNSYGWKFHLAYDSFKDHSKWREELIDKDIYNSYGDHINYIHFYELVERLQDVIEPTPTHYEREMYEHAPQWKPIEIDDYIFVKGDWS